MSGPVISREELESFQILPESKQIHLMKSLFLGVSQYLGIYVVPANSSLVRSLLNELEHRPDYQRRNTPNRMNDMSYIQQNLTSWPDNTSRPHSRSRRRIGTTCFLFIITITGTSQLFGAELFPFSPPPSQQRAVDQPSQARPQLSKEDITRATRLADQAKKLTPAEQQQFRENILRKQKDAVRDGSFAQAQYYTELLTQLRQENR